jgi:2-(1,2-epoxy-1,2-dihydrophenyl)acetyl-CoA isomerase
MMDLTLTNRVLSAAEAEAWGLVNRVVPDDEVDQLTADLAQELAAAAPYAIGKAKQVIYEGLDSSLEGAAETEAEGIVGAMATNDGKEGIAAFLEKRDPNWTGT